MLHDGPERHGIELLLAELLFQEVAAHDRNAASLGIIQWQAAYVSTKGVVTTWKALVQLKQECPGTAPDIQHGSALAMLPEYPQFPLEPHRRVITLQLGRGKIVIGPGLVVVPPRSVFRRHRIGIDHRAKPAAHEPKLPLLQAGRRVIATAHRAVSGNRGGAHGLTNPVVFGTRQL